MCIRDRNNVTAYSSPVQVGALTNWYKVACGNTFTVATKTDGTLWSWGRNSSGQLGINNTYNYSSPKQVGALTNWLYVACGYGNTLATKTDGTLWVWGRNQNGQLGIGNTTYYSSPKQVGALTNWLYVVGGYANTMAIKTDGTLWGWGRNSEGQLGLGNTTVYSSPKQVGALTIWSKISCGTRSSVSFCQAIRTNGTLWAWGGDREGQLGLNTASYYATISSPVQVGSLTTWYDVACSNNATISTKTDGTLWSWGNNNVGQLGLGDTTNRSSPVQIGALTNWGPISRSRQSFFFAQAY